MLSFIRDNTRALSSENSGEVLGRQSVKPFCFTQPSQRQTNSQDDFNDPNSVNEFQVSYEDKHNKPSTALKLRPKIPKPGRKKDQQEHLKYNSSDDSLDDKKHKDGDNRKKSDLAIKPLRKLKDRFKMGKKSTPKEVKKEVFREEEENVSPDHQLSQKESKKEVCKEED